MDYIIHYIVCFYLGRRKSKKFNRIIDQDNLYFLKKHLEFLQNCGPEITEATFVVNGDVPNEFVEFARNNAPKNVKINVPSWGAKTGEDWSICCEGSVVIDRETSTITIGERSCSQK